MVVLRIIMFLCFLTKLPRDVEASEAVTKPLKEGLIMAIVRVSEPISVETVTKSGKIHMRKHATYKCLSCGDDFKIRIDRESRTKACSNCARKTALEARKKHGLSKTSTYRSWLAMHERFRPSHVHYDRYGGRGICICERWNILENFIADMGQRPNGHSLDRIDNNGNYEPSNCKWSTAKQQNRNKSNGRILNIDGVCKSVTEWSEVPGANDRKYIFNALNRGVAHKHAVFGAKPR